MKTLTLQNEIKALRSSIESVQDCLLIYEHLLTELMCLTAMQQAVIQNQAAPNFTKIGKEWRESCIQGVPDQLDGVPTRKLDKARASLASFFDEIGDRLAYHQQLFDASSVDEKRSSSH